MMTASFIRLIIFLLDSVASVRSGVAGRVDSITLLWLVDQLLLRFVCCKVSRRAGLTPLACKRTVIYFHSVTRFNLIYFVRGQSGLWDKPYPIAHALS